MDRSILSPDGYQDIGYDRRQVFDIDIRLMIESAHVYSATGMTD